MRSSQRESILTVYYHNPRPEQLDRLLKHYVSKGYRFVSVEELYSILTEKKEINGKLGFISLDDGWQSNIKLLPVIEKYNAHICIFVATEPLVSGNYWWEYITKQRGRKGMIEFKTLPFKAFYQELEAAKKEIHLERSSMTTEELKEIAKHPLVSIQSHTVNHPILTSVPDDVLKKELVQSKQILEELCGTKMIAFSYPNGSLSDREVNETKTNYKIAFTVEQRHITLKDNIYLLPRIALDGGFYRDLLKINGIWPFIKRLGKWIKLN